MKASVGMLPLSAFLLNACITPEGSLFQLASSDLTLEQLRRLEEAPPPRIESLPRFRLGPPAERRAQGRSLLIAGAVVGGIGAAFLLTGGLLYAIPSNCGADPNADWLCELNQMVAGVGLMATGAIHLSSSAVLLGTGGYRMRTAWD